MSFSDLLFHNSYLLADTFSLLEVLVSIEDIGYRGWVGYNLVTTCDNIRVTMENKFHPYGLWGVFIAADSPIFGETPVHIYTKKLVTQETYPNLLKTLHVRSAIGPFPKDTIHRFFRTTTEYIDYAGIKLSTSIGNIYIITWNDCDKYYFLYSAQIECSQFKHHITFDQK